MSMFLPSHDSPARPPHGSVEQTRGRGTSREKSGAKLGQDSVPRRKIRTVWNPIDLVPTAILLEKSKHPSDSHDELNCCLEDTPSQQGAHDYHRGDCSQHLVNVV